MHSLAFSSEFTITNYLHFSIKKEFALILHSLHTYSYILKAHAILCFKSTYFCRNKMSTYILILIFIILLKVN